MYSYLQLWDYAEESEKDLKTNSKAFACEFSSVISVSALDQVDCSYFSKCLHFVHEEFTIQLSTKLEPQTFSKAFLCNLTQDQPYHDINILLSSP